MATAQSPHSASGLSNLSHSRSDSTSRKRKRPAAAAGGGGTGGRATTITPQPGPSEATTTTPTTREYGFMRDTGEHDSARFVGSSSGIHFIRNVHMRLARRSANRKTPPLPRGSLDTSSADSSRRTRQGELVPGEDDQLRQGTSQVDGQGTSLWKAHEITRGEGVDAAAAPTFDELVGWSKSYFESWHPILPFLNGPDVLSIFEEVEASGISSLNHLDRTIVRSVMSISLADSRQGASLQGPIPADLVFRTVDEAVSSSQFALCQPASIRATQAALGIQLFLLSMLCLNAASRLGGLIVRMAFHLGLHRCPTRYPFFTAEEASRRRRVFWCLYCCERFLSQSLGLPLDIRDDDIDVCYPGEELHGGDPGDGRLQLLTYMAKHARIRGLILELRNKSITVRHDTAERAMAVQTELARWSNEIQDMVEETELGATAEDQADELSVSPNHRLILLLSKYESTISLNRPMMASDPSTPLWSSAMQACISAAKSICITIKQHSARHKIPSHPSGHALEAPMLWPAFIWAIWISAFVLAYAAFERQMTFESALKHILSSKEALKHIGARDTSWPEYCSSAIDELTLVVRELSQARTAHEDEEPPPPVSNPSAPEDTTPSISRQHQRQQNSVPVATPISIHAQSKPDTLETARQAVPPVVMSSAGMRTGNLYEQPPSSNDNTPQRRGPYRYRDSPLFSSPAPPNVDVSYPAPPHQPIWANPMAASEVIPGHGRNSTDGLGGAGADAGGHEAGMGMMVGEGQESMMWFDQMFDSSFSAIDNPFLAAAQLDPSIDPTWSYLA